MSHHLTETARAVDRDVTALGLPLEVIQQETGSREVIRLYLTSQPLGGLLAVNHGEGWIPCYPDRPNYPYIGTWYTPGRSDWPPTEDWKQAVCAALHPIDYFKAMPHTVQFLALRRADRLRPQLRAAAVVALIRQSLEV